MSTRKFSQGTLEATEYTVKIAGDRTGEGRSWHVEERDGSIGFTSPRKEKSDVQAD
jgi:hypothetical protein